MKEVSPLLSFKQGYGTLMAAYVLLLFFMLWLGLGSNMRSFSEEEGALTAAQEPVGQARTIVAQGVVNDNATEAPVNWALRAHSASWKSDASKVAFTQPQLSVRTTDAASARLVLEAEQGYWSRHEGALVFTGGVNAHWQGMQALRMRVSELKLYPIVSRESHD